MSRPPNEPTRTRRQRRPFRWAELKPRLFHRLRRRWFSALIGAALTALLGLVLLDTPDWGGPLVRLSYDLPLLVLSGDVHGDWLQRLMRGPETAVLLLAGSLAGFGLGLLRAWAGLVVAMAGAVGVALFATWLVWAHQLWFSWAIVAGAQLPCAYLCAFVAQARGSQSEARVGQVIPHHTLLREIGRGGNGRVWLVENAVGVYYAAKIVSRRHFASDKAYDREFKGLKNYMPISTSHPGLLQITYVGREEAAGYFFYLMEPADDETHGPKIDPRTYAPRTLASELSKRGRLPPSECISLMLTLTEALEHLHGQGRIHRDIKPANVIYVRGQPKFADIGLVAGLGGVTFAGTQGYLPPEGPNTLVADIYAMGIMLYVACVGLSPERFPELPTQLDQWDKPPLRELIRISFKAADLNPRRRHPSAAALRAELVALLPRPEDSIRSK